MATGGGPGLLPFASISLSRKHVVIFSQKCLFLEYQMRQLYTVNVEVKVEVDVLLSQPGKFDLYYTSYSTGLSYADPRMQFIPGSLLRNFINSKWDAGNVVIICGAVNTDLCAAAHTKSFLIAAGWAMPEEKVRQYGVPAPTPRKMRALIDIVANQTSWYYECNFSDPVPTKVVSLCLANTYPGRVRPEEKEMAENFQAILKDGGNNPVIKTALLCHLMAAIAHDKDFREVQDWAVAPSSSTEFNQCMVDLEEPVRCMMYGRKPEPIFIRHTPTTKSRADKKTLRLNLNYCQKHFRTICVNEKYRDKLKDRVVCVFDDYLTHGNTFEALRNLLVACQVKKIIFVSIGKFLRNDETTYVQKPFIISGDVYTRNYTATSLGFSTAHTVQLNDGARRSLMDLITLASCLQ